ncbi:MAG: hypothetical protein VKQ33_00615 [Candidatus Sericytochromatia bacterium]|nr:hypothetical protein [Candidatus Sericytochromatia bacterium]
MFDRLGCCLAALAIEGAAGDAGLAAALPQGARPVTVARAAQEVPGAVRTALGLPAARAGALLVPFAGRAPACAVRVVRRNPRWLYLEFPDSEIAAEGSRFGLLTDPAVAAWRYTVPAPGLVRLYVCLRSGTSMAAQVLEKQGLIRLAVQGAFPGSQQVAPGRSTAGPERDGPGPVAPLAPEGPRPPADPVVLPPGGEP